MRLLYLNPVGVLGGAERCLLNILAGVRQVEPGADLHLIVATDGPLLHQARALGVEARLMPMPGQMAALGDSGLKLNGRLHATWALAQQSLRAVPEVHGYVKRLQQMIADLRPCLIHSNGIKTHLLTALARGGAVPVVWHVHDFLSHRPVMARVLRWAAKRAAGAITVSKAAGQDAQSVLKSVPIEVIYNAIDVDLFSPAPAEGRWLDELAGLPPAEPGTLRVGLVAVYARWKGQDLFLDAAAQVLGRSPGASIRFYLIGGPLYRTADSQFSETELRLRAHQRGIAPQVGFIGFQYDTASVYRALDVVVHASTQPEPFGLTIVEAMACGRSVIAAQAGGAAELFTPNHDALGVPPNDADALAGAIQQLLRDPATRQRLGQNARQTAVRRFNRARLGPQILNVYKRFLTAPVPPKPGGGSYVARSR